MTKKIVGMLAGLAMAGCGGPVPNHFVDCLQFYSATEFDEGIVRRNVDLARRLLGKPPSNVGYGWAAWMKEPLVPEDQFCRAFRHSVITIRPETSWKCAEETCDNPGGQCLGTAFHDGSIDLGRDTTALLHELIHVWDGKNDRVGNGHHYMWQETGRNQYDIDYRSEYEILP